MIVIIDYGMGNLGSVVNMVKKAGAQAVVSTDKDAIKKAKKLILPGVGAFDNGMKNLKDRNLIPLLNEKVLEEKTTILGLCLGMQLFTQRSEEGKMLGLGWLDAETVSFKFEGANANLKVPHMGWNTIQICQPHPLFAEMNNETRFYFVHSYHVVCKETGTVVAQTDHGYMFPSAIAKENILGVQFHPEKSHNFGMKLFKNFVERL